MKIPKNYPEIMQEHRTKKNQMKHHYENESAMRQANPYLANHLSTIAELIDGLYTAQTGGKIYTWEVTR